jgi:hypothetical protein
MPGQPSGPAPERAQPSAQTRPPGIPAYGDLVGLTSAPASAGATSPAATPTAGYPPGMPPPGYPPTRQPATEFRQPAGYGSPANGAATHPASPERPGPTPAYPAGQPEAQSRFDAFRPEPEAEPAPQQVRSGRVLVAVIAAAVLLLVVPLGIVWLVTRPSPPTFEVGECVRQSGTEAVEATCAEAGAYRIVAKADSADQCEDKSQPYAVLPARGGKEQVLCLRPEAAQ